jgi:hypothetical protein
MKRSDGESKDQLELCSLLCKPVDNPDSPPFSTTTKLVPPLPPLKAFISHLVMRSEISTPTFLTSLVYLDRIKSRIPLGTIGFRCACHRIFLISLILADKYINDIHYKNSSWAHCSIMNWKGYYFRFLTSEITAAERDLLFRI